MFAIIATIILVFISILTVLLILGFPLGEFTMGGQNKILPKQLRMMAFFMLLLQVFFIMIILQVGGWIPLCFSYKVTRVVGIICAVFLSLNTIMNAVSYSKKEKYVMIPLCLIAAICFWITVVQM